MANRGRSNPKKHSDPPGRQWSVAKGMAAGVGAASAAGLAMYLTINFQFVSTISSNSTNNSNNTIVANQGSMINVPALTAPLLPAPQLPPIVQQPRTVTGIKIQGAKAVTMNHVKCFGMKDCISADDVGTFKADNVESR